METFLNSLKESLSDAGGQAYLKVMEVLPQAVWAIVIVGVGLMLASALYFLTIRILDFFAVDKLAGKTPLERMMRSVGLRKSISEIFALLIFWLAVFVTLVLAAEKLDLEQVSTALAFVTRFIPKLIAALFIVIFGMLLAKFLQAFMQQALAKGQVKYAKTIAGTVYYVVLIFVLYLAIEQLGIDLSFLTTNVIIVGCVLLFIVGVGAMIASRTLLENVIASYQLRQLVQVGDDVEVGGVTGKVEAFTLTSVILKDHSRRMVLPALSFFTQSYTLSSSNE